MKKYKYFNYEAIIFFGFIIALGALLNVLGYFSLDSDWFWFLAGAGLAFEGGINLLKQKQFNKKYKIILRENPK